MIKNIIAGLVLCATVPFYGFAPATPTNLNQPTKQEATEQASAKKKKLDYAEKQLEEVQEVEKKLILIVTKLKELTEELEPMLSSKNMELVNIERQKIKKEFEALVYDDITSSELEKNLETVINNKKIYFLDLQLNQIKEKQKSIVASMNQK